MIPDDERRGYVVVDRLLWSMAVAFAVVALAWATRMSL